MNAHWIYELVFSDDTYRRMERHICFWLARVLMCFLIGVPFVHSVQLLELYSLSQLFYNYIHDIVLFDIPLTYAVCYILIPKYLLKENYSRFGLYLFFLLLFFSQAFISYEYLSLRNIETSTNSPGTPFNLVFVMWKLKVFLTYTGVSLILFTSIKAFKIWYFKEKENQQLLQLNKESKIEILKSKIHPHFLFNTLNTIYSFTMFDRSKTKGMLERLYNILHYMIYDCNTEYISVSKEINILLDYINLEKERYGNRLSLTIHQTGEFKKALIAPLLLQPFVENAFKHGVAKSVSSTQVDIFFEAIDGFLHFTISNSIINNNSFNITMGIGIENIRSRLNILFPDRHVLEINQTENMFKVKMVIPLKYHEK